MSFHVMENFALQSKGTIQTECQKILTNEAHLKHCRLDGSMGQSQKIFWRDSRCIAEGGVQSTACHTGLHLRDRHPSICLIGWIKCCVGHLDQWKLVSAGIAPFGMDIVDAWNVWKELRTSTPQSTRLRLCHLLPIVPSLLYACWQENSSSPRCVFPGFFFLAICSYFQTHYFHV